MLGFSSVLQDVVTPEAVFTVANSTRPPADYLFNTLLPEMLRPTYVVEAGTMSVRTTMAGMVGTDSPYPPVGMTEASSFLQRAIKLGSESHLTESQLIEIQSLLMHLGMSGGNTREALAQEALNFLSKVIVQAHLDRAEWMRGQALVTGALSWTFNKLSVNVDYGVPAPNKLATRTGNDAWDGSTSKFWDDIALLMERLFYNARAFVIHPDTLLKILGNPANNIQIVSQTPFSPGGNTTVIRRLVGDLERPSDDFREAVTLIAYGDEAEVFDISVPGQTSRVPFMPKKKILAVGSGGRQGYVVGQGSTPNPELDKALGYTHVGPTVEGNGAMGRWAQLWTPEGLPMQLHGRAASWVLPVVENPNLIAIATSQIDGA